MSHPLLRPLTLGLARLDDSKLLRTLRRLNLSSWADLTSRSPDGTRHWLDLATLLPDVVLPSFPPSTPPWPGDLNASRPGQFWRLTPGLDEWAWGGIYQIIGAHPELEALTVQRWSTLPGGPNPPRPLIRTGSPTRLQHKDFVSRVTHRLLVSISKNPCKGTIHGEFPDSLGRGALFLSADFPDWCSHLVAACFEIPPTLRALGGSAQVAELLAIYAGLSLLSTLNLRGTIYSDCLATVKKLTRQWTPGTAFQDAGAAVVTAARALLSPNLTVKWTKGHPERSGSPPPRLGPDSSGASTWLMP